MTPGGRRLIWVLAALGGVFAVARLVVEVTRRTFRPPQSATSLVELSQTGERKKRLARVVVRQETFYVWLGRFVWLAGPSGPACYVFNSEGKLVTFTPTTGDLELHEYCDAAWKSPDLKVEDVLTELKRTGS
jgi:hypothetical protein